MQRPLVFALVLLAVAAAAALWFFLPGDVPPPSPLGRATAQQPAAPTPTVANAPLVEEANTSREAQREIVAALEPGLLDDPDIRAALCGFTGRVVDHQKTAVAECGVRIYRGAIDSVLQRTIDFFDDQQQFAPDYIAGETRTDAEGRFRITGVWPRGIYVLLAGIGSDAPMHQVITRTPSPGEIVDLGDIVLDERGVIVGTVVDDDGEPMAGALVRAADIPGTLASFFPIERFDPKGALLVREEQSPVRVLEMPVWVEGAFEHLPIPTTRTATDGSFRLVGVIPGSNMLATTADGFLSDVKPSVQIRGGQEKDVGTIRMRRGEELVGRVLDQKGEAVPEAEVFAGSTLTMGPVDLGQRVERADAEGRFQGTGFAPGKVTVAARRGKGHPWVLAEPQPIIGEVVVTLPATFHTDVAVTQADGKPVEKPRFRLLAGKQGQGAAEMYLLGFSKPIDLDDRLETRPEGVWRISQLLPGQYTLIVDVDGQASGAVSFQVVDADLSVAVKLEAPTVFTVRVLDLEDRPIKNALVSAEVQGASLIDMPMRCGRTDADGRLVIDRLRGETLRVSAEHPRWGAAHGQAKLNEELVLRMAPPGSLRGLVLENGKPAEVGKFTVGMMRERGDEPRGAIDNMPQLLAPGLDGTFAAAAVQPGSYSLVPIPALDALRSPGGVFGMVQGAFYGRYSEPDEARVEVQVLSGQVAQVTIEAGEKPIEGPTARVMGSVTIDGRLASGTAISAWGGSRRFGAEVDERGRFDLGVVPAGDLWISVAAIESGLFFGGGTQLWSANLELGANEVRELTIEVQTSSMSGICVLPDGSPAASMWVQAQGTPAGSGDSGGLWLNERTDAEGRFRFAKVPAGTWTLSVQNTRRNDNPTRGELSGIELIGGITRDDLRLQLQATILVKGRIDLSTLAGEKPQWGWLEVSRDVPGQEHAEHVAGIGVQLSSGEFRTDELSPGSYRMSLHVFRDGAEQNETYECGTVVVPPTGLADLVLVPQRKG